MQNKMNMPAVMQAMYQPPVMQQTPEQQAYWKLNTENGQKANAAINNMPFVLDPAMAFGLNRDQMKDLMYQPKPPAEGDAAPEQQPQTEQEKMMALLQQHPELMPVLMQQIQQQNFQRYGTFGTPEG